MPKALPASLKLGWDLNLLSSSGDLALNPDVVQLFTTWGRGGERSVREGFEARLEAQSGKHGWRNWPGGGGYGQVREVGAPLLSMLRMCIALRSLQAGGCGSRVECVASDRAAPQAPSGPADRRPRPQSRRRWSPAPRMCAKRWAGPCCCAARYCGAAPSVSPRQCGASKGSSCLRRLLSPSPPRPPTTLNCASTPSLATAAAATNAASRTTWALLPASFRSRVSVPWVPPHPIASTWG